MEVKVIRLLNNDEKVIKTELGLLKAKLKGDYKPGDTLDVEVGFDDDFVWGENIQSTNLLEHGFYLNLNELLVVAIVSSVEDDDVIILRCGDSIIMIDVIGTPSNIIKTMVQVRPRLISLHPTGI